MRADREQPHPSASAETVAKIADLVTEEVRTRHAHAKALRRALRHGLPPPVEEYKAHRAAYRARWDAVDATHAAAQEAGQ